MADTTKAVQIDDYIPSIDLRGYFEPTSPTSKDEVIAKVRAACLEHGFFQIVGHGVPVDVQRRMLACCKTFFDMPNEQKTALSLRKFSWRRGYEYNEQKPSEDVLPDMKEGFFVGRELPVEKIDFFKGPNVWPDLAESEFRQPVLEYFEHILHLGKKIWEVLVVSLGHPPAVLEKFTTEIAMLLKLLRYPAHTSTDPRQFGSGEHTDYGGITILLQQPGKDGLEVWHAATKQWIYVPAVEDKYVINLGDMVQKWTGGEYKSTVHRVLNKVGGERFTVPAFWYGDLDATNPLNPDDMSGETVSQHIKRKFNRDYALPSETSIVA